MGTESSHAAQPSEPYNAACMKKIYIGATFDVDDFREQMAGRPPSGLTRAERAAKGAEGTPSVAKVSAADVTEVSIILADSHDYEAFRQVMVILASLPHMTRIEINVPEIHGTARIPISPSLRLLEIDIDSDAALHSLARVLDFSSSRLTTLRMNWNVWGKTIRTHSNYYAPLAKFLSFVWTASAAPPVNLRIAGSYLCPHPSLVKALALPMTTLRGISIQDYHFNWKRLLSLPCPNLVRIETSAPVKNVLRAIAKNKGLNYHRLEIIFLFLGDPLPTALKQIHRALRSHRVFARVIGYWKPPDTPDLASVHSEGVWKPPDTPDLASVRSEGGRRDPERSEGVYPSTDGRPPSGSVAKVSSDAEYLSPPLLSRVTALTETTKREQRAWRVVSRGIQLYQEKRVRGEVKGELSSACRLPRRPMTLIQQYVGEYAPSFEIFTSRI